MNPEWVTLDCVAEGATKHHGKSFVLEWKCPRGHDLTGLGVDLLGLKAPSATARDHTCWLKGLIGKGSPFHSEPVNSNRL